MKASKVVLAVVITLALLVVARRASQRQIPTVTESTTYNDLTLTHVCNHIYKGDETSATFDVEVTGGLLPENASVVLYYHPRAEGDSAFGSNAVRVEAVTVPGNKLVYRVVVPNQGRGTEFAYRFQLEDDQGRILAKLPTEISKSKPDRLWFRFEGARSIVLLVLHILGMFGGFLLMVMVLLTTFENVRDDAVRIRIGKLTYWTAVTLFLGTFVIGLPLEHQVYATYWTGIPLGRDITDSKGLIVFLYWLIMVYLLRGSAIKANPRGDSLSPMATRWLALVGVLISLGLYLIPHSSGNF